MRDEFLLEKAYRGWGIPTFVVKGENQILYQRSEGGIPVNTDAVREVRKKWKENKIPALWHETMDIIHMGFEDDEGSLYLFGPAAVGNLSRAQIRDYQFCHGWKSTGEALCPVSLGQAVSCLSIMYALLTGKQVSEQEILTEYVGKFPEQPEEEAWNFMDDYETFFGYQSECAFLEEFKRGGDAD